MIVLELAWVLHRFYSWHESCYSIDSGLTIDSINGTRVGMDLAMWSRVYISWHGSCIGSRVGMGLAGEFNS